MTAAGPCPQEGLPMIPLSIPEISGNEWKYIKECLDTNWVSSSGRYVDLFEEKFAEAVGSKHAVAVSNGTSALHLALNVLGIGAGDEVIVPSLTFAASVNPILYAGAEPVFCDVCPDTYVLDVQQVEGLISGKTKAVMVVHLYGHPVDMEPLMDLAKKHHLHIIEDATESLGSEYRTLDGTWRKTGSIGDFGCFSFNGNKTITTGGGGMLVSNSDEYSKKAKYLSTQAKTALDNGGWHHSDIGFNYRMPNILAAMGVAQLEKLNEYLEIKRNNAAYYGEKLEGIEGLILPREKSWGKNCFWLYSPLINADFKVSRDRLIKLLKDGGVESRPFFSPLHGMKPYGKFRRGNLGVTDMLAEQGVNLPSSVSLKREDIDRIVDIINHIK